MINEEDFMRDVTYTYDVKVKFVVPGAKKEFERLDENGSRYDELVNGIIDAYVPEISDLFDCSSDYGKVDADDVDMNENGEFEATIEVTRRGYAYKDDYGDWNASGESIKSISDNIRDSINGNLWKCVSVNADLEEWHFA